CARHAFGRPDQVEVSLQTMRLAREIGEVLSRHALAAFDLMGEDTTVAGARKVWAWIVRKQLRVFKFRDCFRALQGTFHRADDLNPAFGVLVERGYIAPQGSDDRPGRPSRPYLVNPTLTKDWSS